MCAEAQLDSAGRHFHKSILMPPSRLPKSKILRGAFECPKHIVGKKHFFVGNNKKEEGNKIKMAFSRLTCNILTFHGRKNRCHNMTVLVCSASQPWNCDCEGV